MRGDDSQRDGGGDDGSRCRCSDARHEAARPPAPSLRNLHADTEAAGDPRRNVTTGKLTSGPRVAPPRGFFHF
ncbi:unnamed protein product [Lampetra planeri]